MAWWLLFRAECHVVGSDRDILRYCIAFRLSGYSGQNCEHPEGNWTSRRNLTTDLPNVNHRTLALGERLYKHICEKWYEKWQKAGFFHKQVQHGFHETWNPSLVCDGHWVGCANETVHGKTRPRTDVLFREVYATLSWLQVEYSAHNIYSCMKPEIICLWFCR
jgi:hypothetical protein